MAIRIEEEDTSFRLKLTHKFKSAQQRNSDTVMPTHGDLLFAHMLIRERREQAND